MSQSPVEDIPRLCGASNEKWDAQYDGLSLNRLRFPNITTAK